MSGFEILFLGLVLMCTSNGTAECPLINAGSEVGAKALLVNGTENGPDCTNYGCPVCGADYEPLHSPVVVFRETDDIEGHNIVYVNCSDFASAVDLPHDLKCWQPVGELCVTINGGNSNGLGREGGTTQPVGHRRPHDRASKSSFEWVAPVTFFEEDYRDASFAKNLGPGERKAAIASIDLPQAGTLSSVLVGQNNGGYPIWTGRNDRSIGNTGQALADGILWTETSGRPWTLRECTGGDNAARIEVSEPGRLVVVNLPPPIFKQGSFRVSEDYLGHFRMFYRLFEKNYPNCKWPYRIHGPQALLAPKNIPAWLSGGPLLSRSALVNLLQIPEFGWGESVPEVPVDVESDAALCPPSKFP